LPHGITVSVGKARQTSAQHFLEHQELVPTFLAWLSDLDAVNTSPR
jgi:hypothetical protein